MDTTTGAKTNDAATPPAPPVPKTSWTIMVYVAADNTLANFGVESLKQLLRGIREPVGNSDQADVTIAAQFSIDAPGGQMSKRYIFDESSKKKPYLRDNAKAPLDASANLALSEREALEKFLKWVYEGKYDDKDVSDSEVKKHGNDGEKNRRKTDHYALILWSHGPELFFQPPSGGPTGDSAGLYLTPGDLHDAINNTDQFRPNGRKLDIVGFDACSMSMFEMAYEINDRARLMIASQEEVPDASFPYHDLVKIFREKGRDFGVLLDALDSNYAASQSSRSPKLDAEDKDAKSLDNGRSGLLGSVEAYLQAYQDYVVGKGTGMHPVTLTLLNLAYCDGLREAVGELACALLKAKEDPDLPRWLIGARKNSQDYAGGLYVDLYEFCKNLSQQLEKVDAEQLRVVATEVENTKRTEKRRAIGVACAKVGTLLEAPTNGSIPPMPGPPTPVPDSLILVNGAVTQTGDIVINNNETNPNHGISIYLPYLTDRQFQDTVNRPLVKGRPGTNGGKGIPILLNGAAGDYLASALQGIILTTESYYGDLKLAADTAWYSFITDQWTRAIHATEPDPKLRYSARQIEINLLRKPTEPGTLCKP